MASYDANFSAAGYKLNRTLLNSQHLSEAFMNVFLEKLSSKNASKLYEYFYIAIYFSTLHNCLYLIFYRKQNDTRQANIQAVVKIFLFFKSIVNYSS